THFFDSLGTKKPGGILPAFAKEKTDRYSLFPRCSAETGVMVHNIPFASSFGPAVKYSVLACPAVASFPKLSDHSPRIVRGWLVESSTVPSNLPVIKSKA